MSELEERAGTNPENQDREADTVDMEDPAKRCCIAFRLHATAHPRAQGPRHPAWPCPAAALCPCLPRRWDEWLSSRCDEPSGSRFAGLAGASIEPSGASHRRLDCRDSRVEMTSEREVERHNQDEREEKVGLGHRLFLAGL